MNQSATKVKYSLIGVAPFIAVQGFEGGPSAVWLGAVEVMFPAGAVDLRCPPFAFLVGQGPRPGPDLFTELAHVFPSGCPSHRQPSRATQLGFLHQPEHPPVLVSGQPMSVPSVRTQVKEPVSAGVTLGTLAVVTEDTKLTVDITEPGGVVMG